MADYTQPDVVPKRVRFFDGQFLQDQDFIDEQRFHLDRERRQSRLLRLTGVATGLTVASGEPFQITVTRGMAVDSLGRHLVLAADTTLPLAAGFAGRQGIEVHLVHRESATDVAQTGGASARRWDESPKLVVVAPDGTTAVAPDDAPPDLDGPTVPLARLAVAGNGEVTVDLTATLRTTLSVGGALGVGTADPGSDLEIGDFDPQDRHLTFKVAGGDRYRSGIRLWAGPENEGYSLEYDHRPVAGQGLHVRTHRPTGPADGTTRLFVDPAGHVGIGTTAPANAAGWGRVVDVVGAGSARLSVRTANVEGGVLAHDAGKFGDAAGMAVGTTSANPLTLVTDGVARLGVTAAGHVGIGTTTPANTGGWGRVVDVVGAVSSLLSVRTANIEGNVLAHDGGMSGAPAGMIIGTTTRSPLSLVTGRTGRLTIDTSGRVGIGTSQTRGSLLAVVAENDHLRLRREKTETGVGEKFTFLQFDQADSSKPELAPVSFNIRFEHAYRFGYRLEVQQDGFHFRTGDISNNDYRDIHARKVTATELRIGDVVIGEHALKILEKLANNQLVCELRNNLTNSYLFQSINKFGTSPYFHALAWIPGQPAGTHTHTFWKFEVTDR